MNRLAAVLTSVVLAVLVWFYARSRDQTLYERAPVPVTVRLSADVDYYRLEQKRSNVLASFVGPRAEIDKLQERLAGGRLTLVYYLTPPSPRLTEPRQRAVTIQSDLFPWFPGVSVTMVRGEDVIPVVLVPMTTKKMAVKLSLPDPGLVDQARSRVEPAMVQVRGARHILQDYDEIPTEPINVPPLEEGAKSASYQPKRPIKLVADLRGEPVECTPSMVRIRLELKPSIRVEQVKDVPVRFLCPEDWPHQVRFLTERARVVTLLVRGPSQGAWALDQIYVFVDLTPERYKPSLYADEPCVVYLPPGLALEGKPPTVEKFEIVRGKP